MKLSTHNIILTGCNASVISINPQRKTAVLESIVCGYIHLPPKGEPWNTKTPKIGKEWRPGRLTIDLSKMSLYPHMVAGLEKIAADLPSIPAWFLACKDNSQDRNKNQTLCIIEFPDIARSFWIPIYKDITYTRIPKSWSTFIDSLYDYYRYVAILINMQGSLLGHRQEDANTQRTVVDHLTQKMKTVKTNRSRIEPQCIGQIKTVGDLISSNIPRKGEFSNPFHGYLIVY